MTASHDDVDRHSRTWTCATAEQTRAFGQLLGGLLRGGDVVLLTGSLGAGKTTLASGLGRGLGVRGPVTSPTFVLARVHPNLDRGPSLVHVDAYRLGSIDEIEDLDLEIGAPGQVTLIEWGGHVLRDDVVVRCEVVIVRDTADDETRTVTVVVPDGGEGGLLGDLDRGWAAVQAAEAADAAGDAPADGGVA